MILDDESETEGFTYGRRVSDGYESNIYQSEDSLHSLTDGIAGVSNHEQEYAAYHHMHPYHLSNQPNRFNQITPSQQNLQLHSNLNHANSNRANLNHVNFNHANLHHANMHHANLNHANLESYQNHTVSNQNSFNLSQYHSDRLNHNPSRSAQSRTQNSPQSTLKHSYTDQQMMPSNKAAKPPSQLNLSKPPLKEGQDRHYVQNATSKTSSSTVLSTSVSTKLVSSHLRIFTFLTNLM